jgi:uncharacterized protein
MSSYPQQHPCQKCGACCASFRVAFHWREAEPQPNELIDLSVPQKFTEDLDTEHRCMKGTNDKHQPKCVSLIGRVGESAHCSIYKNRPSPCRKFMASYENGYQNIRCDEARIKHGLKALSKKDFRPSQSINESNSEK